MEQVYKRLEKIRYQILPGVVLTDEQIVAAIRSIYDAAINESTVIPEEVVFPTEIMGATITWSSNKKQFNINKGSVIIEDNLIDTTIPSVDEFKNYLSVNNDFLFVNNDYLLVTI